MSKQEIPITEIKLTTEQLKNKNTLYIATQRQGGKKEFMAVNIQDLESIVVTTDKTIALELFNGN